MRLLLDTHTFLFSIAGPERLSTRMRKWLRDPKVERWVSVVSLWEIAVKVQIGKLSLPSNAEYYRTHLQALQAKALPVTVEHSMALMSLPLHHRDPFDRLLIAQAASEGLTLASRDRVFQAYGTQVVW
jgi:PIN domain nuclease of toxin-antitoxin system